MCDAGRGLISYRRHRNMAQRKSYLSSLESMHHNNSGNKRKNVSCEIYSKVSFGVFQESIHGRLLLFGQITNITLKVIAETKRYIDS